MDVEAKFPFAILVGWNQYISAWGEMFDWLDENVADDYHCAELSFERAAYCEIRFKEESDAVAFRMKWL
jgi:hypothetical protein